MDLGVEKQVVGVVTQGIGYEYGNYQYQYFRRLFTRTYNVAVLVGSSYEYVDGTKLFNGNTGSSP